MYYNVNFEKHKKYDMKINVYGSEYRKNFSVADDFLFMYIVSVTNRLDENHCKLSDEFELKVDKKIKGLSELTVFDSLVEIANLR